ncbi:minor capsid protein [Leuconostocaceae bacterium ESL0958]|nr:minor capsid protein [Leuconostocaceae bacterium ESL0958]
MANNSHYPELFKEYMDIEYAKSQVSRMRALVIQTKLMMADFAEQETPKFQDSLESSYENNYYKSTYDIQDGLGTYQANFQQVSKADLKAVANQNWRGSNFSKRLWGNMVEEIPGALEKVLAKGVTLGYDANRMTREAKQVLKNAKDYNVHRLILTEKRHIAETATMDSYHEQDVEQYRYLATLESRTCSICGGLDHKIFKTSEIERGMNYPLIHPHCRCTTTPYFAGMDEFTSGKRWSKNPVTGEKELVDRMSFDDWYYWVRRKESDKLIGKVGHDEIKIEAVSLHAVNRMIDRGVTNSDIISTLEKPYKVNEVKIDDSGRPSMRFVGKQCEFAINPETGNLLSVNPINHKVKRQYGDQ